MSKSLATKEEFVERRALGESYGKIATALHISKSTCSQWEEELASQIAERKQEEINALYEKYQLTKKARVEGLGKMLERIDNALAEVDLTTIPPEKLLKMRLEYSDRLKAEYTGEAAPVTISSAAPPAEVLAAIKALYERIRNGDITTEQAAIEGKALTSLISAYDATENRRKINAIDAMLYGVDYEGD